MEKTDLTRKLQPMSKTEQKCLSARERFATIAGFARNNRSKVGASNFLRFSCRFERRNWETRMLAAGLICDRSRDRIARARCTITIPHNFAAKAERGGLTQVPVSRESFHLPPFFCFYFPSFLSLTLAGIKASGGLRPPRRNG